PQAADLVAHLPLPQRPAFQRDRVDGAALDVAQEQHAAPVVPDRAFQQLPAHVARTRELHHAPLLMRRTTAGWPRAASDSSSPRPGPANGWMTPFSIRGITVTRSRYQPVY